MSSKDDLRILTESLRERDLPVDQNELKQSLASDHGGAIHDWIQEYISQDTLLSKEEMQLYKSLQKSGEFQVLEKSVGLPGLYPHSDQDISAAIEELKKQTETIERQTAVLRTQQSAVATLVQKSQQDSTDRDSSDNEQYRAWKAESASLDTQIDELLQSLNYQIADLTSRRTTLDGKLRQKAAEILIEDDRLLSSLQKLSQDLDPESPEEDETSQRVRDLCARFIKHTVEGVRTRLDRVYLEATNATASTEDNSGENEADIASLREELESLFSEIVPVAQMSAEQQYLGPALNARTAKSAREKARTQAALKYMIKCISTLTKRMQDFASYADEYQSHRHTTAHAINAVKSELARSPSPPTKTISSARDNAFSPTKRPNRRRSSIDEQPETQLLRNLNISIPLTAETPSAITASLYASLADRKLKLTGHAANLQVMTEKAMASSLHEQYVTLEMLREVLLSETRYNRVRLVDEEIEEAIGLMEVEVESLKAEIGRVDVEKLKERNVLRDALVERWAR